MDATLLEQQDRLSSARRPSARARRFPLALPVEYRPLDEAGWRQVVSFNVSHSGILVSAAPLAVGQAVQLRIALPWSTVLCDGRVARVESHRWMAFTIDQFVLHRLAVTGDEGRAEPEPPDGAWRPCLWPDGQVPSF